MKKLIDMKTKNCYTIASVGDNLPAGTKKRLIELGIVPGNKVAFLIKNKIAKSGIVRVWGSMISLDYYILSMIEVE